MKLHRGSLKRKVEEKREKMEAKNIIQSGTTTMEDIA